MNVLPHPLVFGTRPRNPRVRGGFTLNEVLVALGILAIGSVAVASLFPTAAFLQKEAVKETLRQNHTRSTDALLEGVGLDNATLLDFITFIDSQPAGYPAYEVRAETSVPNDYRLTDPAYDVFALAEIDTSSGFHHAHANRRRRHARHAAGFARPQ